MIYLDASALVKLVRPETETVFLESYLSGKTHVPHVASELVITELHRSLRRLDAPSAQFDTAGELLQQVVLMPVNRKVLDYASGLPDPHLRSLHAIHLATALRLRSSLTAMVTYDKRLAIAATESGAAVESPGTSTEHA